MDKTISDKTKPRQLITGLKKIKRVANAREKTVAIPPIARIQPVPVELAVRAVPPQIEHVAVAIGVRKIYEISSEPLPFEYSRG